MRFRIPIRATGSTAVFALQRRRETAAIEPLERLAESEALPNIARAARNAVQVLRGQGDSQAEMQKRITELGKENADLKSRIESLEKRRN